MPVNMSIGELSARSGVSQSALRFYERQGLISADRSDGNQRRYHGTALRKVALIQAGKTAGVPLERIREALETLPADRAPTKRDWERLSRSWRRELDERIDTLLAIRGRLTTCIGCGCLSLKTCGLLNPGDEAAALGSGARYLREYVYGCNQVAGGNLVADVRERLGSRRWTKRGFASWATSSPSRR